MNNNFDENDLVAKLNEVQELYLAIVKNCEIKKK